MLLPALSIFLFADMAPLQIADELTGQSVVAYVTMKPDFDLSGTDETALVKELVLQVRKTIGPFAAPKRVLLGMLASRGFCRRYS